MITDGKSGAYHKAIKNLCKPTVWAVFEHIRYCPFLQIRTHSILNDDYGKSAMYNERRMYYGIQKRH